MGILGKALGFSKAENIERVHRKFCKWLVKVKQSTNSLAMYAELGRFPLFIKRHARIIQYWLNLHHAKQRNQILQSALRNQQNTLEETPDAVNWLSKVRDLLCSTGFAEVWLFPKSVIKERFIPILKDRLKDVYIGQWYSAVEISTSLSLYREIKPTFDRARYLQIMDNFKLRNAISRIRLSSHKLAIETGRHHKIEREQRICDICKSTDIEDEYHFIIICPIYSDLREQHINKFYYKRPSVMKFIELLNSQSKVKLNNLAQYINKAFERRKYLTS